MKTNTRMEIDEYFIKMARLASFRGACIRRKTGCILTNNLNHVIATGYNGRARGVDNCLESPCSGSDVASGMGLDTCEAIHAEANALLQCPNVEDIKTAYCTTAPCVDCIKLLMNTGCDKIVFQDDYPHMELSENMWTGSLFHRTWDQFPEQYEIFEMVKDLNARGKLDASSAIDYCKPNDHVWIETNKPAGEGAVILDCTKCPTSKEVCK